MDVTVPVLTRDEVGELARAFNRMIEEIRQRERIKDTFGKFVDPRIVTRLISAGDGAVEQADRRVATIFFSDIAGFSGLSERLTAAAMVNLLNAYFTGAGEVIHGRHGIIDKYIGDAVMAFWTTPFSSGDEHAADACLAALEQQEALAEFRKRIPEITGLRRDAPDIAVRMGVATGEVVVGTLGSPRARSFTVIGDTVNLASRLEGVNKAYGTGILIAEDTFRLAQAAVEAREIDFVTVAGKTEPIRIYELLSRAGQLDATRAALRERFAEALGAYRRKDWDEAARLFEAAREIVPDDKPSTVFLDRIATLRGTTLPDAWDGVWRLASK
jgi:adenylate cyclase